jgi:hypothetical protein
MIWEGVVPRIVREAVLQDLTSQSGADASATGVQRFGSNRRAGCVDHRGSAIGSKTQSGLDRAMVQGSFGSNRRGRQFFAASASTGRLLFSMLRRSTSPSARVRRASPERIFVVRAMTTAHFCPQPLRRTTTITLRN